VQYVSQILRYVYKGELYESLITVNPAKSLSGYDLSQLILHNINEMGLQPDHLVVQCYDGAPNMRGQFSGMQKHVKDAAGDQAMYVWCWAHCLNRVLESFVKKVCTLALKTFGVLQKLYVPVADPLKCRICSKSFSTKWWTATHEKSHERASYHCSQCGASFQYVHDLKKHKTVHLSKYQCSDCSKCFSTPNKLSVHPLSHSGVKPFLCSICGRLFSVLSNLVVHSRSHSLERPYQCQHCHRQFRHSGALHAHMKVHESHESPWFMDLWAYSKNQPH